MQTSARLLLALNCFLVSFPRLACPATMLPLAAVRSRVPLAFCRFNWCRVGRAGPKVYGSWAECKAAVTGFPRAEFKSFPTYEEASRFALGGSALRAFHSSSTASAAAASSKDPAATRAFPEEKKVEVDMAARATTTFAVGKTPAKPGTEKSCVVYFDGGSRGNPGHAGVGCIVYDTTNGSPVEVWRGYRYIGFKTNNSAEYEGLLLALKYAKLANYTSVDVRGDSELVIRQLSGIYRVMTPALKPLYHKALRTLKSFSQYSLTHVYREENAIADAMANEAMDKQASSEFPLEEPEEKDYDAYNGLLARLEELAQEQKKIAASMSDSSSHRQQKRRAADEVDEEGEAEDEEDELLGGADVESEEVLAGGKKRKSDDFYTQLGQRVEVADQPLEEADYLEPGEVIRSMKPRRH